MAIAIEAIGKTEPGLVIIFTGDQVREFTRYERTNHGVWPSHLWRREASYTQIREWMASDSRGGYEWVDVEHLIDLDARWAFKLDPANEAALRARFPDAQIVER